MNDNTEEMEDFEDVNPNEIMNEAVKFYESIRAHTDVETVNEILSQFQVACKGKERANIYCALAAAIVNVSDNVPYERAVGLMIQMLIIEIFNANKTFSQKH